MAEVQERSSQEQETVDWELELLKKELDGYRQLMLPLNKVLEWEQKHYAAILVAIVTLKFAVIWYLEPSVLTLFSLAGLWLCMVEYAVPFITNFFFASKEWTVKEERQYENICIRILNAKTHLHNFKLYMAKLKSEKPRMYLLVMMGVFATLAWIGSLIDNLFLTYLLVVFILLVPGLRKHGILQQARKSVMDLASRLMSRGKQAAKRE